METFNKRGLMKTSSKIINFLCIILILGLASSISGAIEKRKKSDKKTEAASDETASLTSLKKVVAVADFNFENVQMGSDIAIGLGDLLVDKLVNTGKFIVVERDRNTYDVTLSRLAEREQAAKQMGMSRGAGADVGKAAAAQALFVGTLAGIGKGSSIGGGGAGWGGGGLGLGALGVSSEKVRIIVRWYDTTSLEIKGSHECSKTKATLGLFGGGIGGSGAGAGGGTFRSDLAKTFSGAMDNCVKWIVENMDKLPWEGKIIQSSAGKIYINAGTDAGVKVGDEFTVYKAGQELVDPDSGLSLGVEETLAGKVQVIKTMPKFSITSITSGGGFGKGDIIRYE